MHRFKCLAVWHVYCNLGYKGGLTESLSREYELRDLIIKIQKLLTTLQYVKRQRIIQVFTFVYDTAISFAVSTCSCVP